MSLNDMTTRHLFFTGKGGVGKTTVASATALQLAECGYRTLIVSTDPASNLDDVFGMAAGTTPTSVPGVSFLWIMNIDPEAAAAAYREHMVRPYRGVLPDAAIRSMEEQLSGACTVEIAAFHEFTASLADATLTAMFDRVVFDTAPTGHTLRLLSLPSAWSGFLDTSSSGASCLGPLAGLEQHRAQYSATVDALADPNATTVVLVTRAEMSAMREAARAGDELAALGISRQRLVVNGVLTDDPGGDPVAEAYASRQSDALTTMPSRLVALPTIHVPLIASNLTGLDALRVFAAAMMAPLSPASAPANATMLTSGRSTSTPSPVTHAPAGSTGIDTDITANSAIAGYGQLRELVAQIAADGHGVVMTMGKGGVGKTTLAASLALALARAGRRVHLSTTDPAAHVEAAVGADVPTALIVSRIDPVVETARYSADVIGAADMAAAAVGGLDINERALLEEDLRSPCTEEIAVFRAFARTVAEAGDAFVVLDTAPTGHTLLLLDAAESYHREVARTAGSHVPEEVRALLPRLRDARYTKMLLVTLAESTPVQEASRLQDDLRRAGIEPYGWVVNASLAASGTQHPLLAARAQLELPHLARVRDELAARAWITPWTATPER
ncbi:MAG: TRC40/GET3/ArsA family transport-energizing ATPase [Gemmatimonadaceae bacterium]|nr:TRC40/GET3/ArsA family transport-energizing ATPase [Gemmatimonadaceae bacterium]